MPLSSADQESRKGRITATRLAQIVGLSRWGGPIDAYLAILGLTQETPETTDTRRGNILEPALLEWYRVETGRAVEPGRTIIHQEHPQFAATPDGLSGDAVVEIKAPRFATGWGEPGTDEVPEAYLCQVAWQMACTDKPRADVAALLHGDLRIYTVERNHDLEAALLKAAHKFWRTHIEPKIPPPPDASPSYSNYLASVFKTPQGEILPANDEATAWLKQLRAACEAIEAGEAKKCEAENHLKALIGNHAGIETADARVTWKAVKPRARVNWEALACELRVTKDQIAKHTEAGKSYRRFLARFNQERH